MTDGRPQPVGELQQALGSQRHGTDEAGLDVEREGVEAFAVGAPIPDRRQCSVRVLRRIEEGRQVPGDDPHSGRVGGVDELSERVRSHEVDASARSYRSGDRASGLRRGAIAATSLLRVRPERRRVDVEPGSQARVSRTGARGLSRTRGRHDQHCGQHGRREQQRRDPGRVGTRKVCQPFRRSVAARTNELIRSR